MKVAHYFFCIILRILDITKLFSVAVDLDDLILFTITLESTAELMLEIKQLDQATFFYNQLRIFFSYTLNYHGKCRAL